MTDNRRIALYLNHLEIGGAETVFVELGRGFLEAGCGVDFVLGERRGVLLSQIPSAARIVELSAPNAVLGIPKLFRYLRRENPAAFLTITELTSLAALTAKIPSRVSARMMVVLATTISRHKRAPLKKKLERALVALLYPAADDIIALSRGAAQDLARYAGLSLERIRVIYSPVIKPSLFFQAGECVQHPFFQSKDAPVVLSAGRLSEPKNFPLLMEAFALLRRRMPLRLLILGEGEMRPVLEDLALKLGIQSDFSLPGFASSPYPYMRQADVFVLSSKWEGLPTVLVEAMACGAPVVSADCPSGPAEILDGGKYGHLVPPGDPHALAAAIESSLKGDRRKPPSEWLDQFRTEPVVERYLKLMGLG